ncbi:MAG: M23 family metallopeptidase [Thermoleophilaceae bacterium]
MRRTLAPLLAALALPASAAAAMPVGSGGVPAGDPPASSGEASVPAGTGGTAVGETPPPSRGERPRRRTPRRPRSSGRPVLRSFALSTRRFYVYGARARVTFEIADRSREVRVKLVVRRAGSRKAAAAIDLGDRRTGVAHRVSLDGFVDGRALPQGPLDLRLSARDPGGKTLRASARASVSQQLELYWHRFPLPGSFSYGGDGSRFGAGREGHSHQGQDLSAPEGTPVVAPRGGVVQTVAYQAAGAGHYVILDGAGEDRDYAFMHLQTGSIRVREGQRVRTGQLLGAVGSTGASSGPHLHFEVWEDGGWYEGGSPVDPLPYLRRWDAWS